MAQKKPDMTVASTSTAAPSVPRKSKQTPSAGTSSKSTAARKRVVSRKPRAAAANWTLERIIHYIQEHAYYIWEDEGRPAGKSLDVWLRAEREMLEKMIKKTFN